MGHKSVKCLIFFSVAWTWWFLRTLPTQSILWSQAHRIIGVGRGLKIIEVITKGKKSVEHKYTCSVTNSPQIPPLMLSIGTGCTPILMCVSQSLAIHAAVLITSLRAWNASRQFSLIISRIAQLHCWPVHLKERGCFHVENKILPVGDMLKRLEQIHWCATRSLQNTLVLFCVDEQRNRVFPLHY